ncbi:hypothetical protein FACS1894105_07620 [Clostridia bacterium]|nr:hypothetical protein FACS1894105_07620 [Clostridia bacterium]
MNKLILKEVTQEHVIYYYQPEGRGDRGVIVLTIGSREPQVEATAAEDDPAGHYAYKAKKAILQIADEKNYPLEFTQAWY